jgi:hypothetical protein
MFAAKREGFGFTLAVPAVCFLAFGVFLIAWTFQDCSINASITCVIVFPAAEKSDCSYGIAEGGLQPAISQHDSHVQGEC